jgi:hypothetical protein
MSMVSKNGTSVDNQSKWKELAELEQQVKEDNRIRLENFAKYLEKETEETIAKVTAVRQAGMVLEEAGFKTGLDRRYRNTNLELNLGHFGGHSNENKRLAAIFRKVRRVLGVSLPVDSKEVAHTKKKLIKWIHKAAGMPGVTVIYTRPLPKGSRCKITTQVSSYSSLVCDF